MEEHACQIVHAIAGRTRIRIPWLKANPEQAGKLQRLVESINFVTSVRMNLLAQSVVILYKSRAVSQTNAEAQFVAAVQQCSPEPAQSISDPAGSTAPESTKAAVVEVADHFSNPSSPPQIVSSDAPLPTPSPKASVTPQDYTKAAASSQNLMPKPPESARVAKTSLVEEIPSPWDEPVEPPSPIAGQDLAEPQAEIEPQVEIEPPSPIAGQNVTEPQAEIEPQVEIEPPSPLSAQAEVKPQDALPSHSTASLARRLNATSQAVTQRRRRPDFAFWTQSQDPEQIAWRYDAVANLFYPIDSQILASESPAIAHSEPEEDNALADQALENPTDPLKESAQKDIMQNSEEMPAKKRKTTRQTNKPRSPKKSSH